MFTIACQYAPTFILIVAHSGRGRRGTGQRYFTVQTSTDKTAQMKISHICFHSSARSAAAAAGLGEDKGMGSSKLLDCAEGSS
jgi:hypothetical protein